jgi:DNA-binding beta-propeller fold protein YncE
MRAGQELAQRWRGIGARQWQPAIPLLGVALPASLAMAALWHPPPGFPLIERFLAALLMASALLAGCLRLLAWLRLDRERPAERANGAALAVLALGGLVLMAVGGLIFTAVRLSLPPAALPVVGLASLALALALLALASQDLGRLSAADAAEVGAGVEAASAEEAPVVPTPVATPPAPSVVATPRPAPNVVLAWLDSRWMLAVLVVLALVAGTLFVQRLRLLDGALATLPVAQPGGNAPAAAVRPDSPAAAPPLTEVAAGEVTTLVGPGSANAQPLAEPRGVALDENGLIYVAETGAKRVSVFDQAGQLVRRLGGPGQGEGTFDEPVAVAVDAAGDAHVADAQRNAIQVFGPDGRFRTQYGGNLGLYRPRGLAIGDDGLVYLADTGRNRVLVLSDTGEQQEMLPAQPDATPPPLDQPTAAVGSEGIAFVAEPTRGRLHRLTLDGQPVGPAWTLTPTDTMTSARLTAGPAGEVVVAEVGAGRVLIVCPGGDRALAWKMPGGQPRGAALGRDGALYVVDAAGALLRARLGAQC